MSLAAETVSELPVAAQTTGSTSTSKVPAKRTATAKADLVNSPEPR